MPLLQSEPSLTIDELHLPRKPSLGPPTPPTSMLNLATSTLADVMPQKDEHMGHQFLMPDEAPSPFRLLVAGSPLVHSCTMHVLGLASQDPPCRRTPCTAWCEAQLHVTHVALGQRAPEAPP
ncbi:Palmitoyltransferase zdhhc14 [Saguinus oedipus]|uniref:Palmitoyltransferase zdhhc14 n=1 Tax=Saguinus oedipus TaxID=9490 RepID=A0ABQ9TBQ2_SAGOE|nr:Palmitoyltransferase zdhhc14 [Saguinus oedipus]